MHIVECVDVSKTYKQGQVTVQALKNVSLKIDRGEFLAVAGGETFESMSQSQLANLRLNKIGFVFQAYNLIPVLSAIENVEYVMLLQGLPSNERRAKSIAILDEVGLEGKYDRRPAELSGGQQQRVAVARAIVSNPSIVLADEPTANLDSKTGQGLLEMMKQMNAEKEITFIFSTHDRMVMDYARRLVKLRDGRLADDQVKSN
jgi:putative ABC transport system ATP-binding protein